MSEFIAPSSQTVRSPARRNRLAGSLFLLIAALVLIGQLIGVLNRFVTVMPAYVEVSFVVATMSPEDRLQIGANLQEVNIPPESVEDLLKGKVVMFYVTDSSGAKLTDSEVAKALAAKGFSQVDLISHENGGVVGVLRLLKAYQLAGLRFKPSAVPVSRILGGGG